MSVDDKLIEICTHKDILITNDVYLKIKAIIRGINTKGYGGTSDY